MNNRRSIHNVYCLRDCEVGDPPGLFKAGEIYSGWESDSGIYEISDAEGVLRRIADFYEHFTVASDSGYPAAYVDRWFANRKDGWIVQLMDAKGQQIGDPYWDGWRPGAEATEKEWCERYKLPTRKVWERQQKKGKGRGTDE